MTDPVALDVVFERFPASVRGAVVIRGLDGDPHQVRLTGAAVVEVTGRVARPVAVGTVTVDVTPRGEVLVPFEILFAGLDPGWYRVQAEGVVDGSARVRGPAPGGPQFLVSWPRGSTRRGSVAAGVALGRGKARVEVEHVDCRTDSAVVRWRHVPGGEVGELVVLADGKRLPVLEAVGEPDAGTRATVVYPVLRAHRELGFSLGAAGRPVTVRLS